MKHGYIFGVVGFGWWIELWDEMRWFDLTWSGWGEGWIGWCWYIYWVWDYGFIEEGRCSMVWYGMAWHGMAACGWVGSFRGMGNGIGRAADWYGIRGLVEVPDRWCLLSSGCLSSLGFGSGSGSGYRLLTRVSMEKVNPYVKWQKDEVIFLVSDTYVDKINIPIYVILSVVFLAALPIWHSYIFVFFVQL